MQKMRKNNCYQANNIDLDFKSQRKNNLKFKHFITYLRIHLNAINNYREIIKKRNGKKPAEQ